MNRIRISLLAFILFVPVTTHAGDFSFYGVKFGDPRTKVYDVFQISHPFSIISYPGHEMKYVNFTFDNNERLIWIEAYYILPSSNEKRKVLLHTIDEVFLQPLQKLSDIEAKTYTYTDPLGVQYIILSIFSWPLMYADYLETIIRQSRNNKDRGWPDFRFWLR